MATNSHRLTDVGPLHPGHGYPLWYEDENGVRLELALNTLDEFTPVIGELPTPGDPVAMPDNFPDESFYFSAEAEMSVGGNGVVGRARMILAVEAAFGGTGEVDPDQQVVFGRIRVRMDDLIPFAKYDVVHPYGDMLQLEADDRGRVFVTEDIGVAPEDFRGALGSHVAPFLRWTSGADLGPGEAEAPAGYLGDGVTAHTIIGSPFNTNLFRVSGPSVAVIPGRPAPVDPDVAETSLFTVQGRIATVLGVEPLAATYQRSAGGDVVLDVFARSVAGQTIDAAASTAPRVQLGDRGTHYAGRLDSPGGVPATVTVHNRGDVPPSSSTIAVTDAVIIIKAEFSPSAQTLEVAAESSDAAGPALTVTGFGALAAGSATFNGVGATPHEIEVTSAAGGSATRRVQVVGPALAALPVTANAGADQQVSQGSTVTLQGAGSSGDISAYQWTQDAGTPVALTNPTSQQAEFVAPANNETLTFSLTVDGTGGPVTDQVDVVVGAAAPTIPDDLTDLVVEFRTSKRQWRISGSSTGSRPNRVTAAFNGTVLGMGTVDATAAWSVRKTLTSADGALEPTVGDVVDLTSLQGAAEAVVVRIRN